MRSLTNGQTCGPEGMEFGLRRSCAIGVMAKSPRPGHSKTRLCPPLRPEQAAQLSAAFLRDTTESIAAAALSAPIVGYAAYAPSGTEEALAPHLASGTSRVLADGSTPAPLGVEGFGRCLLHAIQQLFAAGHTAACVLSSDTPTLLCFGVEKGPRLRGDRRPKGTPLTLGFTMAPFVRGGLDQDVDRGDGREDPPGVFRSGEVDQGDLP